MLIPYQYANGYKKITKKNKMNRRQGWGKRNIPERKHNLMEMWRYQSIKLLSMV
jgi:hypothetical protein